MNSQQEVLVSIVLEIYEKLSDFQDLSPSKSINALFSKLVLTCLSPYHIDVSNLSEEVQEKRSKLIQLCGEAEGLLEMHFTTLIGSHEKPLENLTSFPYYSNYIKLSQLEFTLLSKFLTKIPTNIAFIGSGPLPLSSIVLATNHLKTATFHNYDINPSANAEALKLVSSDPDLSKRMIFYNADIMNVTSDLKKFDVVFLAALVGMEKEKKVQFIQHLANNMAPGAFLLLRSAHGARAFLYPVVEASDLRGFEVLTIFHPTDEIVNSVVVARKHPRNLHLFNGGCGSNGLTSKCSEIQGFSLTKHGKLIEKLAIDDHMS